MLTGPTVAPIGDLSDSAGPTAGTISVALEEMPAIADGLDTVSRTCAERTMPILGIAAETRLFLGINGRAQQAAGLCAGLATDLGGSALKFGATAAAVRAAHSSYLQVENTVAGWFESLGIAKDGKLPDGRSTRDHFRGLIAGEPGEANYLLKLIIPEFGYFSASRTLPYSPIVAGILFGFTAYMDAKWNPEIARQRAIDRLASTFGIPRGLARKALGGGLSNLIKVAIGGNVVYNVRTAAAEEYGVATHRGEKNQLSVGASSDRLMAIGKAQDLELERSRQDPLTAERSAVLVTVMYEAGHEGDPAHALYVVSIPGTIFGSWGGSIIDGEGTLREASGPDQMNSAYMMILQALRDAGAPKGARVYMEGFSQGAMIAHNMANSAEVAKEINIVGVYAQAAPMRGMSAKQRDFAVDYVEGEGDGVPDIAKKIPLPQIFGEPWHPDERDTVITVNNHEHHAVNYHEALHREGHSGKVPGGMRAAMDGKDYVLGEQKITSASSLPDGLLPAVRVGITIGRTEGYAVTALASGTVPGGLGIVEGIDQLTGGHLAKTKRGIEDTVSDVQQGMEIAKQKAEGLQREAGESAWAVAKQIPAVIEGVQKTIPHPEPTPQESQNPQPAWPEMPVPQMPNSGSLPAPNIAPTQPVLSAAKLLGSNIEAPAYRGFIVNAPQDTQPVSRMPMAPAEDIDPGFIVRPEAQPTLGSLAPRLIQGLPDAVESLPRIGDLTAMPHVAGGDRQGGDYDGVEPLIPPLSDQKSVPMPMFPPENIDPGFRAPGDPEDLTPLEEREPLMV